MKKKTQSPGVIAERKKLLALREEFRRAAVADAMRTGKRLPSKFHQPTQGI